MSFHQETNPHFIELPPQQREGRHSETPPPSQEVSRPRRQDQQQKQPRGPRETEPSGSRHVSSDGQTRPGSQFHSPWMPAVLHQDYPESHFPLHPQPQHQGQDDDDRVKQPQHRGQSHDAIVPQTGHQDQDHRGHVTQAHPSHQRLGSPTGAPPPQQHDQRRQGHGYMPKPGRTKAITWLAAVFCAIFWIVIFLGGLIVLIVYLSYRPRSPRFDVSSATLNAAYIDSGSLLNADFSMLANFTNPNRKASVVFSHMIIDLYYGSTLIATQYIQPFSASKAESWFANVHMVTSQVRLPLAESQRLQEQINRNGIIFEIKGVFRVRSNLGSFLRYSYRLYGHCTIMVTSPPSGVLRATKCRTKR